MAECWERHNRYLVTAESIDRGYSVATSDGYSLLVEHDLAFPGPVVAYIMRTEETAPSWEGERWAARFAVVGSDAEALKWFEEMMVSRPWVGRH